MYLFIGYHVIFRNMCTIQVRIFSQTMFISLSAKYWRVFKKYHIIGCKQSAVQSRATGLPSLFWLWLILLDKHSPNLCLLLSLTSGSHCFALCFCEHRATQLSLDYTFEMKSCSILLLSIWLWVFLLIINKQKQPTKQIYIDNPSQDCEKLATYWKKQARCTWKYTWRYYTQKHKFQSYVSSNLRSMPFVVSSVKWISIYKSLCLHLRNTGNNSVEIADMANM